MPVTYRTLTIDAKSLSGADTKTRLAVIDLISAFDAGESIETASSVLVNFTAEVRLNTNQVATVQIIATEDIEQDTLYRFRMGERVGYFAMPAADADLHDLLEAHPHHVVRPDTAGRDATARAAAAAAQATADTAESTATDALNKANMAINDIGDLIPLIQAKADPIAKATNADVDGETDDVKYLTVAKVFRAIARKIKNATTTIRGVVLIARNEDVDSSETDLSRVLDVSKGIRLLRRMIREEVSGVKSPNHADEMYVSTGNDDNDHHWTNAGSFIRDRLDALFGNAAWRTAFSPSKRNIYSAVKEIFHPDTNAGVAADDDNNQLNVSASTSEGGGVDATARMAAAIADEKAVAARGVADTNKSTVDRLYVFGSIQLNPAGIPDRTMPENIGVTLTNKLTTKRIIQIQVQVNGSVVYTENNTANLAPFNGISTLRAGQGQPGSSVSVGGGFGSEGGILNLVLQSTIIDDIRNNIASAPQWLLIQLFYKFEGTSLATNVIADEEDRVSFGINNASYPRPVDQTARDSAASKLNEAQVDARARLRFTDAEKAKLAALTRVFRPRGNFAIRTAYAINDVVVYNSHLYYVAQAVPAGNTAVPVDGATWVLLSADPTPTATESRQGTVELATQTEMNNGSGGKVPESSKVKSYVDSRDITGYATYGAGAGLRLRRGSNTDNVDIPMSVIVNDDRILDLAQAARAAADRGKLLAVSPTDENALVLLNKADTEFPVIIVSNIASYDAVQNRFEDSSGNPVNVPNGSIVTLTQAVYDAAVTDAGFTPNANAIFLTR